MKTKMLHPITGAWFESVRGRYTLSLSLCLNDLVDRSGFTVWLLTCWETFTFSMNFSPNENWL